MTQQNQFETHALYAPARSIVQTLSKAGFTTYFAGGCVRDMILNCPIKDIDIATSATPAQIMDLFPATKPVGEHFGVILVIVNKQSFEVATFRTDASYSDGRRPDSVRFSTPQQDALRRDFTINGLFYDPLSGRLIDYVQGQQDLQNASLRAIGRAHERFSEDYLRMLRAVRFACRFNFTIEQETADALETLSDNILKISSERIFAEITLMLQHPSRADSIRLMHKFGLLKHFLPEVAAMHGVPQPEQFHPEGDVLTHTLLALSYLRHPSIRCCWSMLLHDIGKPPTITFEDRIRFNNHHRIGAHMSYRVLKRLKAPTRFTQDVFECVDNHMNFMNVTRMRTAKLKRFLSRPTIVDELEQYRADCLASHGDISNYTFLQEKLAQFRAEQLRPEPFLSGKDLIALGFTPGPEFKTMLEQAYDLQLEEALETKQQAIDFIINTFRVV